MMTANVATDYLEVVAIPQPRKGRGARSKCSCCGKLETHHLFANGICMGWAGCEMYVWRQKRQIEKLRGFR